jgi:acetolactate synthase-1/2/3 large subunit
MTAALTKGAQAEATEAPVGDIVIGMLEAAGVTHAYGVISIHNMPMLDALLRRQTIAFVTSRGEAGAVNMADAAARATGRLGVAITSTGTGAGNACGALVEAQTAGTPLLHLTGQIDSPYLDRGWGFIHEAPDQPRMLEGAGKAFLRVAKAADVVPVLREAIRLAQTPPCGAVSVEIPIDVQKALAAWPPDPAPVPVTVPAGSDDQVEALIDALRTARRPVLWAGGGARGASGAITRLADLGCAVMTSVQGRGALDEAHAMSLGSFTAAPASADLYRISDLMIVAGSHLRSNETHTYAVPLPERRIRIDLDPRADGRGYGAERFICADAAGLLQAVAGRLDALPRLDPDWSQAVADTRAANLAKLRADMGPYAQLLDAIEATLPADALWVRDITLSNSIWGNRRPMLNRPGRAIHAVGGGIGQGLAHAIGAASASGRSTLALIGDGGFMLNVGELATAVEAGVPMVVLLMNDRGYGVIRNIQDAAYGGRRGYTDLHTPDFGTLVSSMGARHARLTSLTDAQDRLRAAFDEGGVTVLEIDMGAVGPFGITFAGPPVGKR